MLAKAVLKCKPSRADTSRAVLDGNFIVGCRNDARTELPLFFYRQLTADRTRLLRHLVRSRRDVAVRAFPMLHRSVMPCSLVALLVILPSVVIANVIFVIGWEGFDLLLGCVDLEIVLVFRRADQPLGWDDELLAGKPSAGIDHNVANIPGCVVEDHVVDLAQLLVVTPV